MSVKLNAILPPNPTILDAAAPEQELVVSWNASMTAATDNPVSIELKILDENDPVYFISNKNNNEKVVAWNQQLKQGKNDYKTTIVMKVTKVQTMAQVTKIKITTRGSDNVVSYKYFSLLYK